MKKKLLTILLILIVIFIVGQRKYNNNLNNNIASNNENLKNYSSSQDDKKSKVFIIGTVHFETDSIKKHHFYNYLDSISPSIILYEGDSSTVKQIVNKTDYFSRLIDAFKREKRIEKPVVTKYLKNNPGCLLLPYEWEQRVKFKRKHKLDANSKKLINAVIKLYSANLLNQSESLTIERFLKLNKILTKIDKNPTMKNINNLTTDSILKLRQHYVYKEIPEIAKGKNELTEYLNFIPIHMNYWDTRNKAMVKNILKQIKYNSNKTIVILTGFYHRYYLIEELIKHEEEYDFILKL